MALSRRSKRFRFRCKDALLVHGGIGLFAFRLSEAAEESIYNRTCVKQSFQRAKRCGLFRSDSTKRLRGGCNVGLVAWDERLTSFGQTHKEIHSTLPIYGPKNIV